MKSSPRVLAAFLLACAAALPAAAADAPRGEEAAVAKVLDDWHDAAAKADEPRYFAHFDEAGVFLGTDAKERWNVAEFRAFAHPYFAKGKAWSFTPRSRHVAFAPGGAVAWFDELLDTPNL